jgi:hypothetical protein
MQIGIVGDFFVDHVVFSNRDSGYRDDRPTFNLTSKKLAGLLERYPQTETHHGGTMFNLAYELACRQIHRPKVCDVHYLHGLDDKTRFGVGALDVLREVGIQPHKVFSQSRSGATFCIVSEQTGVVEEFLILEETPIGELQRPASFDVVAIHLADLLRRHSQNLKGGPLDGIVASDAAVVLGDRPPRSEAEKATVLNALKSFRRAWIFGNSRSCDDWGLRTGNVHLPSNLEIVATRNENGAQVLHTAVHSVRQYAPPEVQQIASTIGAGDAFAAGYLFARIGGENPDVAAEYGTLSAAAVLAERGPRRHISVDLNARFQPIILRSSSSESDGALFARVRNAPRPVVISGGQTGIDQLGMRQAASLGLPCFAIYPEAARTEDFTKSGPGTFAGLANQCHSFELSTPSYRFRTWVTAFLADGTLLWDYVGSEGALETIRACRETGRPLLNVTDIADADFPGVVDDWLDMHSIRVLNIAGNRRSYVPRDRIEKAAKQIHEALFLLTASKELKGRRSNSGNCDPRTAANRAPYARPYKCGFPAGGPQETLFRKFLRDVYNIPVDDMRIHYPHPKGHQFCFMRSRDLISCLREGHLDIVFVGSDAVREPNLLVLETGLFPCAVVAVGSGQRTDRTGTAPRVCSQYPDVAEELVPASDSARTIGGSAEAWISLGAYDVAIDTWRTGRTAERHGLQLLGHFFNSSLAIVSNQGISSSGDQLVTVFARWVADGSNFSAEIQL